ncbi:MAG: hypothetical protein QGH33_00390 [Pirellulaceae bacterium]|nr:hypothetical protein [Pirellulaceae bacterium]
MPNFSSLHWTKIVYGAIREAVASIMAQVVTVHRKNREQSKINDMVLQ